VTRGVAIGVLVVAAAVCAVVLVRFFRGPDREDYVAELSHTVGYVTYVTYAVASHSSSGPAASRGTAPP
jgi:multisubunit Na+/H+ antiporter MnhF subunit